MTTVCAGLVELAGLVDDWWGLGQEQLDDAQNIDGPDLVTAEVRRRRQELIDIIFKQDLSPTGEGAEKVGETRSRILGAHLDTSAIATKRTSHSFAEESWSRLDLSDANLSEASLMRVDLSGAALTSADLSGANLIGANLSGANLIGADLSGANLLNADLSGARLLIADLSGARLMSADLSGARLKRADLVGARLVRANLIGADLSDARLKRADLSGARLSDAGSFVAELTSAQYDENTKFPDGFDPDNAGMITR
ncbi:Uncharacterized protein in mobD 3'region [Dietzia timorensis]|uniref:Uncharacterized protein in mobD 3'region n=1 Tax=Dietzia timorensis TaxID=499555 RepID=A0A173LGA1_9ACTN|nr:Uncharacterized protein in mobD 3'region [Dietzia timorensis]